VAIEWTRIQVTLRLSLRDGVAPDPSMVRLVPEAGGASMAPTRATLEDGLLVLRFNVMQGPRQEPLGAGRWRLATVSRGDHGVPIVVDPGPIDPGLHGRRFVLRRGVYEVTLGIDAGSGALVLAVELHRRTVAPAELLERPADPDGLDTEDDGFGARRLVRRLARRWRRRGQLLAFAVALRLARLAGRNGRRILFTSDSRGELGGNLKLVHDRMVARGLDRDLELLTLFKPGATARRSLRDKVRLPWLLGRADVILLDDYQPVIYRVDLPKVRIVQLWHAVGAFKTVGYSRVGKPGGPDPYGRAHKNYSLVTVSARADVPVYAEAFGVPEERVVPTGMPRSDRFFSPDHAARATSLALDAFPEARGRRVVLFAPTFRGSGARTATYDLGRLDYTALHELCVEKDAVCIVRMHPFVPGPLGIPAALGDRLLDGSRSEIDINDLLFAVDLLITDYSSIVYEFSTLGRPMLFYAWDLEEYIAGRDFYEPYEAFVPGRIVRTFPELLDAIRHEDFDLEKVASFAQRHFEHRDARSTDRVIDLILGP
jgi:CDP-glycerol glycerophosphotransferase (TagB/SpsB family)